MEEPKKNKPASGGTPGKKPLEKATTAKSEKIESTISDKEQPIEPTPANADKPKTIVGKEPTPHEKTPVKDDNPEAVTSSKEDKPKTRPPGKVGKPHEATPVKENKPEAAIPSKDDKPEAVTSGKEDKPNAGTPGKVGKLREATPVKEDKSEAAIPSKDDKPEAVTSSKEDKPKTRPPGKVGKLHEATPVKENKPEAAIPSKDDKPEAVTSGKEDKPKTRPPRKVGKPHEATPVKEDKSEAAIPGKDDKPEAVTSSKEDKPKTRPPGKVGKPHEATPVKEDKSEAAIPSKDDKPEAVTSGKEDKPNVVTPGKVGKPHEATPGKEDKSEAAIPGKEDNPEAVTSSKEDKPIARIPGKVVNSAGKSVGDVPGHKQHRVQTISNQTVNRLRERISFARVPSAQLYDDLLDVQIRSYLDFLQEDVPPEERKPIGLQKAFLANFPVEDNQGILQVEFLGYTIENPRYTEEECRERELTYAKTLKAKLRLSSKADPTSDDYIEAIEQEVYMGTIPAMTPRGTFIINGAERVVVSQIHRSPGVFFDETIHANGMKLYSARIIPFKGSWVEFTTDINNLLYAYIDRKKKFLATTFLRALRKDDGTPFCSTDEEILALFDVTETLKPSQLDESHLGRIVATDTIDFTTGEVVAMRNAVLDTELLEALQRSKVEHVTLYTYTDPNDEPIIKRTLDKDTTRTHEDALELIYRQIRASEPPDMEAAWHVVFRICFDDKRYDIGDVGRFRINRKLDEVYKQLGVEPPSLEKTVLTNEDIIAVVRYLLGVQTGKYPTDDVDHLSNRRVRTVGEQLSAIYMTGISRLARGMKDKLTVQDLEELSPASLTNARAVTSVVNQFFGTNQLSQFMDQTNPLAELTHKRRVSALGPGGLTRERAGFEVRDVHYTHYGRLCPIETPEGPNIGLISSLAMHARVNQFGFIETPYRKVVGGKVTNQVEYLSAEEEEGKVIAPASTPLDDNGRILGPRVRARKSGDYVTVHPEEVEYMDVSTDQIISPAASLIPFLEHDDANRALMGSNMQRQAVPLLRPEAPYVGTGMEARIARDARALLVAEDDGVVEYVSAECIRIRYDDPRSEEEKLVSFDGDRVVTYPLLNFFRTNQDTCICQRPLVHVGDRVTKGMPIADGACTERGELALGRNVLVAFMPWRGYNFEDAIIVSERLVAEDVFTSVHIEEFTAVVRDTKRGEEEFTRDIPSMSEEQVKDLDEHGIIRVGSKVKEGDILIGKVTPKGEVDPTPEEKLLRAIFGDRAGEVKDASLKAPPGLQGTVINAKLFQRRFIISDAEYRAEEKRRRDAIDRQEQEDLLALDRECIARLAKLLEGEQSLGITTIDGKRVYMSGTRITAQNLQEKYDKGDLPIAELNVEHDWVASEKKMKLVRRLLENYRIRRNEIIAHARMLRNRASLGDELQSGILSMAKVFVAKKRKLQVGDKMAGRHGNKGIVSKIVPIEDMPFLPDGTPVDIILNPLGVPSRMNLGQLYETALGWAASKLGLYFASPVFDGASWEQVGDYLENAGLPRDGKTVLYDGRSGEPFEHKVTVGVIYMMKLSHMVEDKIHARSVGPYSLITQQPLGGKAQFGGQRLGEMEVWALEAYGASATLQEMLTVKSDDVNGRARIYEAIVKNFNAPQPNLPEAFMVLVRELQGLCLDVRLDGQRIEERITSH